MDKLLTAPQVAGIIGCHVQTIYKWKDQGKIPYIKRNGLIRFKKAEIEDWIEQGSRKLNPQIDSFASIDFSLAEYDKILLKWRTELKGITTWSYPFGSVRMRKTKNKEERYYIDYQVDGQRVRKALKGVRTRAEAVKVLSAESSDAQRSKYYFHQKNITFGKMAELFLEKYSKPKKKSWKSADRVFIRNMKPFFGEIKLSKITPLMIEDYKLKRLENGIGRRPEEKVSNSTINRELQCLRKLFNKAIDWGYAKVNPVLKVDFLSEKGSIRKRVLSEDEEVLLIATAPLYLKHIILVALHTGMRKGEVLKLRWKNVDFETGEITIVETKDNEDRIVPMNPFLFSLLLNLRSQNGKADYVFTNPRTGKHYVEIKRAFTTACDIAGIKDFHFHDLRHTHASRLVRNGIDLNTVKELLGHSSITTTQRYLHSQAEQKRIAVNSLSGQSYCLGIQRQNNVKIVSYNADGNITTPSNCVS